MPMGEGEISPSRQIPRIRILGILRTLKRKQRLRPAIKGVLSPTVLHKSLPEKKKFTIGTFVQKRVHAFFSHLKDRSSTLTVATTLDTASPTQASAKGMSHFKTVSNLGGGGAAGGGVGLFSLLGGAAGVPTSV